MAVTIVVLSGSASGAPELSLTLDAPRLVIGRGEGCEVRLPDASVSHRHASLRQRGGEYMLFDESSRNGTFLGPVRLPPQTPRAVRSGERLRVGRVWLEVRLEPAIVKGSTAAAAKELALALVARGLAAQGEEPGPRLTVLEGPDAGATLVLADAGRRYVIGRAEAADLRLHDEKAAPRQLEVTRKGDALALRDTGAGAAVSLDETPVGPGEVTWRAGQALRIGKHLLGFDYPAADALAEIERSPDEALPDGNPPEPPRPDDGAEPAEGAPAPAHDATPTPAPTDALTPRPRGVASAEAGGWGKVDSAVVMLAVGVMALSLLAAWWFLGR